MDYETQSIFTSDNPVKLGLGFHNIGSGVLRYSSASLVKKLDTHYGQRCGHIPLNAERIGVYIETITEDTLTQLAYLSKLYGRKIEAFTTADITQDMPFMVPYVNVPQAEDTILGRLHGLSWGLPGRMTDVLKNKATFYALMTEIGDPNFISPEYVTADLKNFADETIRFLQNIRSWYVAAQLPESYPVGIVARAADEDGNYGSAIMYEVHNGISVTPDGDAKRIKTFDTWESALDFVHTVLLSSMDIQKESRIVISRYVDMVGSPGISLVFLDGHVASLGWNGQLQKKGSKACVGTSTYHPPNETLKQLQEQYESYTATVFEKFLRKTCRKLGYNFEKLRGLANIDIMLPGNVERQFMQSRGIIAPFYIAECNPRFTNYTDAILAVLGVQHRVQSIQNMKAVIHEGIYTMDKYDLPEGLNPKTVREAIYNTDQKLSADGNRIICRMATSPMGLIFVGDRYICEQAMQEIVANLVREKTSGM